MNKAGEWGEIYACRYLRKNGYDIMNTNFRCRFGETDVICTDGKYLIVVEVKARNNRSIAEPAEFVDEAKQRKIILTSSYFLAQNKIDMPVRFDVVEIVYKCEGYGEYSLKHIKDAFRCE